MDTDPSTSKRTTYPTATIYRMITHRSDPESSPTELNDGDTNKRLAATPTPRRLVFSVDEAAFLLSISRGLAYELVARGELPSIRLGRRIVIPRVVLEELTGSAFA